MPFFESNLSHPQKMFSPGRDSSLWLLTLCAVLPGNSILHSAADSVTSAVQKASQALNERGERLGRAEEKTEDLKNSAQQFAETAHKVRQQRGRAPSSTSGVLWCQENPM